VKLTETANKNFLFNVAKLQVNGFENYTIAAKLMFACLSSKEKLVLKFSKGAKTLQKLFLYFEFYVNIFEVI
jgi:hypothetical protein